MKIVNGFFEFLGAHSRYVPARMMIVRKLLTRYIDVGRSWARRVLLGNVHTSMYVGLGIICRTKQDEARDNFWNKIGLDINVTVRNLNSIHNQLRLPVGERRLEMVKATPIPKQVH